MPSEPQIMLYDTISANTESDFGKANHQKLKKAFSNHDNSILKDDAKSSMQTGNGSEASNVNMTSTSIKSFYGARVKRGPKNVAGSGFPEDEAVNLSYTGAPKLGTIQPEGEELPGGDGESKGSTIVSSGLGPNVNVNPIGTVAERAVIDPGYTNPIDLGDNKDGQNDASPDAFKSDNTNMPPGSVDTGYEY